MLSPGRATRPAETNVGVAYVFDVRGHRAGPSPELGLTALGLVGHLIGIVAAYPGRGFAVTGVIVGVTLAAIG